MKLVHERLRSSDDPMRGFRLSGRDGEAILKELSSGARLPSPFSRLRRNSDPC
jgi:hypothetical protein